MIVEAATDAERETLLQYLVAKLDVPKEILVGNMPFSAFAIVRGDHGLGAILCTNYRQTSVEIAWAGDPGWITRGDMRTVFRRIFDEMGCLRAWGVVRRDNGPSRNLARRMGCREVGILENEYGPGKDGVLYSMTRAACQWLKDD